MYTISYKRLRKVQLDEKIESLQKFTKRKITYDEIANILSITKSAIGNRIARGQTLKDYEIEKLDNAFRKEINNTNHKVTSEDNYILDYYPDVCGSCGTGIFQFSTIKEQISVPASSLFKHFTPGKQYFVINAYGNSMEPLIFDKDKLIIENYNGEQIIDNKPYLFAYKDEIFIKRLAKNVDQLMIIPENKDYDTRKLEGEQLKDVNIIGLVVGLMRDLR